MLEVELKGAKVVAHGFDPLFYLVQNAQRGFDRRRMNNFLIGCVGKPSAGKSSFLNASTDANAKVGKKYRSEGGEERKMISGGCYYEHSLLANPL